MVLVFNHKESCLNDNDNLWKKIDSLFEILFLKWSYVYNLYLLNHNKTGT